MRLIEKAPDGGPKSPVRAYFLCEFKGLFSVALLRFSPGGRSEFHTHAFNAWTWFICGDMIETELGGYVTRYHRSFFPKITKRNKNHRVSAKTTSWCFTIRGPWADTWTEDDIVGGTHTVFTNGRNIKSISKR